ncbi:DUF5347 family protein [Providencia sp. PROV091]|uniref:DUF5347 family protein n=1 Tax=Providencia sp. PROV091 TaxID=2949807 RepID=UPI00234922BE|nr:DUF5347 family protein [Providencia sp. PROV091]
MSNSAAVLVKTKQLIQLLGNVKQDARPADIIAHQANIKLYQNQGATFESRVNGLNQAAKLRTYVFQCDKQNPDNRELAGFIEYLRLSDVRMLNMIFYLAEIKSNQHHLGFDEFNKEEQQAIISAINHIKALAALLPKHMAMPI